MTTLRAPLADALGVIPPGDAPKGGKQHRNSIWGSLCKQVRGIFWTENVSRAKHLPVIFL